MSRSCGYWTPAALKNIVNAVATEADDTYGLLLTKADLPPLVGPPTGGQMKTSSFLQQHLNFRYDAGNWKIESDRERGVLQLRHSSDGAWIKIIAESTLLPVDKLVDLAISNAQSVDPKAKEIRRGTRRVNGIRMSFAEYSGTSQNIPFVFMHVFITMTMA
jgi:hypothetical protein